MRESHYNDTRRNEVTLRCVSEPQNVPFGFFGTHSVVNLFVIRVSLLKMKTYGSFKAANNTNQ